MKVQLIKWAAYKLLPDALIEKIKAVRYYKSYDNFSGRELREYESFKALIGKGSTVLDIGANIGLYSKLFASITGAGGKVYCIEPIPFTFGMLSSNIAKSGSANIFPFQFAASDNGGVASMGIPSYQETPGISCEGTEYSGQGLNYYTASLELANSSMETKVEVSLKTIDEFVSEQGISNISFIKCDVEGHELAALSGARKTLETYHPALYVEIMSDPRDNDSIAANVFTYLKDLCYAPFIVPVGQTTMQPWTPSVAIGNDYFFR